MKKLIIISAIAGASILLGFTPANNATSQTIAIGSGSKVIQDMNVLKTNVYTRSEVDALLKKYDLPGWILADFGDGTTLSDYFDQYPTHSLWEYVDQIVDTYDGEFARMDKKIDSIKSCTCYSSPTSGNSCSCSGNSSNAGNFQFESLANGITVVTNYIENGELIIDGATLLAAYNQGKRTFHTDVDTTQFFMQKVYSMYFDGIENVSDMEFDIEINGLNSDIQYVAFPYVESKYVAFTTNGCQNTSTTTNIEQSIIASSTDENDKNTYISFLEIPNANYLRKDTYHIKKNSETSEMKWNVTLTKRTNGTSDPYIPMSTDNEVVFGSQNLNAMIISTNTLEVDCSSIMKRLMRGYNSFLVEFTPPTNSEYSIKNIVLNTLNDLPETEFKNIDFELTINRLNRDVEHMWINDGNNMSYFITNNVNNVCRNVYERYDEMDNGNGNTSFSIRYNPNHDRVSQFNIRKLVTGTYYEPVSGISTNANISTATLNGTNITTTTYTYTQYTNFVSRPIIRWIIKHDLDVD